LQATALRGGGVCPVAPTPIASQRTIPLDGEGRGEHAAIYPENADGIEDDRAVALRTILNHTDGLKGGWDYLFSQFKRAVANFPLADRRKLLPTTRPASVASRSSLPHSDSDMLSA
jgi:hypothetical protein